MSNFKIAVLDGFSVSQGDLDWGVLKDMGDVAVFDRTSDAEKISRAADADAVLTNKVAFSGGDFNRLPRLKYVGVLATGYNNIDVESAKSRSIAVTNVPSYCSDSVAQLAFAHILNIANSVSETSAAIRAGAWGASPDFFYCPRGQIELAGKSLGVVGYGSVGRRVAEIAAAFGMKVSAFSPSRKAGGRDGAVSFKTLDEIFSGSDVISLNCVLNENTRNMVDAASIAKMKDGVWIVNTGRGQLVDEADLARALESGKVGAAAADVLSKEPPDADNPLLKAPNFHITGHVAWISRSSRARLLNAAAENLRAWLDGKPVNLVV